MLKNKIFKTIIFIMVASLFFCIYLLCANWIEVNKLYPWNPTWLHYTVFQRYAPSDCFEIRPNDLMFDGKKGILTSRMAFKKRCNFTHASIWFTMSDLDYFQFENPNNLSIARYGNISEIGRIGFIVNSSDMELYKSYEFNLYFTLKDRFYNFYEFSTDGAMIGSFLIIYDNSLRGFTCGRDDCFNVLEGKAIESPLWRDLSKKYRFEGPEHILIRFNPESKIWGFALKLLDTFILGAAAIIFYEIINILFLSDILSNNNIKEKQRKR